jgi:hypothetical protein
MDDPTQGGAAAMEAPQQASTKTAAPASDTAGSPETAGGDKSWQQAAAAAGPGANTPPTQPTAAIPNATPAPPPAVTAVAAPPPEAKPVYPPGLRGFMDKMIDSLAGAPTSKVRQGADGSVYLEHEPVRGQPGFSNGKQWLRIGAEALLGAAAGMSQRGAGSEGAALGAGVQAGQKFQQQRQEAPTQEMVQLANMTALNHQTAKNALELTQANFKLSEEQLKAWQDHADVAQTPGAKLAGHANTLSDVTKFMAQGTEGYDHQDQAQNVTFRAVPAFDKDGKASGFDIYKIPKGVDDEILPPGTPLTVYNEATDKLEQQKTSGPDTRGHINALSIAAKNRFLDVAGKQSEINERNANVDEKKHPVAKPLSPEESAHLKAETADAWAGAHDKQAKADDEAAKNKETSGPLVDMMGTGQMPVGRMAYLAARNPALLEAVSAKYPGFDGGKIEAYVAAEKEFTSGDVGRQLNSGGTVLAHLNQLRKLNTPASHIYGTPAYTAYHNQLNTLAPELNKFYGDQNIPAAERVLATLGSTLPGNRDAAIKTQVASMKEKFNSFRQQWKNAAPSEAYEAKLPWISPEGQQAWNELDKAYNPKSSAASSAPALTNLHTNPTTGQTIGWNGQQYVDTQTGQAVK